MYASKEELYLTVESLIVTSRVYKDTFKKKMEDGKEESLL